MDSTKIKLISFDLWETLISDNYKTNSTKKRNDLRADKLKLLFKKYNYEINQNKINDSMQMFFLLLCYFPLYLKKGLQHYLLKHQYFLKMKVLLLTFLPG